MSVTDVVRSVTGMWWPSADEGSLRTGAAAYREVAESISSVTALANRAALDVMSQQGASVEAFADFWARYKSGDAGWLVDCETACRQLASALDDYAEAVAHAKRVIEEAAATVAAVIVAGGLLTFVTAGLSDAAAAAASSGVVATAEAAGIALSGAVADIIAVSLTGATFGFVESVAVDLAVVQPIRLAFGDATTIDLGEALSWGAGGALLGGALGGVSTALGAARRAGATAGELAELQTQLTALAASRRTALLAELGADGIKFSPEEIVRVFRDPSGRVVFLEEGDEASGLVHTLQNHGREFLQRGIPLDEAPDVIEAALTTGTVVGNQGRSRTIYEFSYNGTRYRLAISVADNGYVVSANFKSMRSK